jgi:hypothetical protein
VGPFEQEADDQGVRLPESKGADVIDVLEVRWCADCSAERPFEVPPCDDGHGADCPDLACTGCGAALVVGVVDVGLAVAQGVRAGGSAGHRAAA